ncbi:MAG: LuxR C-terminal-related transcriptional regulator [Actinomycetota bacterium]|nr:LuxR C-terminal-related transcriptional regulator [Actinomycetota bacterium]
MAPAGYGKTTVLSEWAERDSRPFAWLTLDDRDNDPGLLAASVAHSLREVTNVDEDVFAALSVPRPSVPAVVSRLMRPGPSDYVLVLDDVQCLDAPAALRAVTDIVGRVPSGSQIALASRSTPPIPVARMRANRNLVELSASDLAMTRAEAGQLLGKVGLELSDAAIVKLVAKTEGWPAALYLAALTLAHEDDLEPAVDRFTGDDRIVADYVRDEFLSSLAPDDLDFLTRSSILDELDGPACDAILEIEGSAERVVRLANSNLLLVPLDRRNESFRCHQLLREMLHGELRIRGAHIEQGLHGRASEWFLRVGDLDRAITHAIDTDDVERSGDLLLGHIEVYAARGREETIRRWIDRFPPDRIAESPTLSLALATCQLSHGDGGEVDHWTTVASRRLEHTQRPDRDSLEATAGIIRATGVATGGAAQMGEAAAATYELLPLDSPWRSVCRMVEGMSSFFKGDRDSARLLLEEGARRGQVSAPHIQQVCLAQLALIALDEDKTSEAVDLMALARSGVKRFGTSEYPTSAVVYAVSALVRARSGQLQAADADVKQAVRLLGMLSDFAPWEEAGTRVVLARALLLLDDVAGARVQLADAAPHLRRLPDAVVLHEWRSEAAEQAENAPSNGRWPLTAAELRLLHYLPTHLSFREIADELVVSINTVKSQAQSVYRKLGVASRREAVACAEAAGLLAPHGRAAGSSRRVEPPLPPARSDA